MHQVDSMDGQIAEDQRIGILDALGLSLAAKRREAVSARAASGIESEWQGDEEFYQGYDDANRDEFVNTASKPTASGGTSEPVKSTGSTVFPNITQPYVDAAAARVGDMLLPTDDRNFAVEPTPIPDVMKGLEPPEAAAPIVQPAPQPNMPPMGGMEQPGGMPSSPPSEGMPPTAPAMGSQPLVDPVAQAIAEAKAAFDKVKADATRKAEKAQTRIDDWLSESQYHAEARKMIDDAAKLGSGVIKGPVPVKRKSKKWMQIDGMSTLEILEEIKPGSFRVNPLNLYPDGACGESIHNGSYIFEYDTMTEKRLTDLKGLPGYIDSQIDRVIEEGPKSIGESNSHGSNRENKGQFGIWYFHGSITADELMAAGCECDGEKKSYPAMITMVNDRVIRASLNPLDSGEFPYDVIPWKRRPGMPWGMGVARQMRTPQRIVVAATRNLMDNAGLGAGPQIVVRRGVEPENDVWEIKPLKIWVEGDDADKQSNAPFMAVTIPMLQNELMAIIQLGMKMAEDVTGMPQLMQGSQGSAPDTVGGMEILNNNSNAVLRRIARLFDSCITEPHIRRYYAWLMEYGEDDDEKGDFNIVARGSSALVERDIQTREIVQVIQMSINPAFGLNPKKAIAEFLKSRRFDPAAFEYTVEEQKQMASQPPPPPPQIEVAKIRAEADAQKTQAVLQADVQKTQAIIAKDKEIAQLENQTMQTRITTDTDRDRAYVDAERERTMTEHDAKMQELGVRRELAMLEYANRERTSLDNVKAKLADTAMKLRTQKELAAASQELDVHKHYNPAQVATPAMEPNGRAPNGQAFQR